MLIAFAESLSRIEAHQQADQLLRKALRIDPSNLIVHLGLLNNAVRNKDERLVRKYTIMIYEQFSFYDLEALYSKLNNGFNYVNHTYVTIDKGFVAAVFSGMMTNDCDTIRDS